MAALPIETPASFRSRLSLAPRSAGCRCTFWLSPAPIDLTVSWLLVVSSDDELTVARPRRVGLMDLSLETDRRLVDRGLVARGCALSGAGWLDLTGGRLHGRMEISHWSRIAHPRLTWRMATGARLAKLGFLLVLAARI
ncbi:hypothetical protein IHE45_15G109100 [Dioscorea alata]|uniref:Uncharacterized protein n=1 Tax=Dioscorea alata TaxID=55571 RepID=A0ACB7UNQ5_DIOAL|nr:hypothetical protein IHE45_15G109100 [Dioscorea alata]